MKEWNNFLEYIPKRNEKWAYKRAEDNKIVIFVTRTNFLDRISQWLYLTPKSSEIQLDIYGSFIWDLIDGKTKVLDIASLLKKEYGQEIEPLYERLGLYFKILMQNQLIK